MSRKEVREQGIQTRINMDKQHWYNRDEMAFSSNLEMANWLRQFSYQNDYNNPKAQLARLYQANINPLYAYGLDSGNSNASVSGGTPTTGSVGPSAGLPQSPISLALQGLSSAGDLLSKGSQSLVDIEQSKNISVDTQLKPDMSFAQISNWMSQAYEANKSGELKEEQRATERANIEFIRQKSRESSASIIGVYAGIYNKLVELDQNQQSINNDAYFRDAGMATDRFNAVTGRLNSTNESNRNLIELGKLNNEASEFRMRYLKDLRESNLSSFLKVFDDFSGRATVGAGLGGHYGKSSGSGQSQSVSYGGHDVSSSSSDVVPFGSSGPGGSLASSIFGFLNKSLGLSINASGSYEFRNQLDSKGLTRIIGAFDAWNEALSKGYISDDVFLKYGPKIYGTIDSIERSLQSIDQSVSVPNEIPEQVPMPAPESYSFDLPFINP